MSCDAAERGETGEWAQSSGHPGIPRGAPQPGRPEIFLWHPAEQTAGTMPGWQRQPGSRAQTLLGVAGQRGQAGETGAELGAAEGLSPTSLRVKGPRGHPTGSLEQRQAAERLPPPSRVGYLRSRCRAGGPEGRGRGRKSRFPKALALLRKMTPKPGAPLTPLPPPQIQAPAPQMVLSHRPGEEACLHA